MEKILELLPSLILVIFCMISLLTVVGSKFSKVKTALIVVPFLMVLLFINIVIFSPHGIEFFDTWSVLSVFIPEFVIAILLGKRKGVSLVVAIINAYVSFYILVLLRNVSAIYFKSTFLEYLIYLVFVPFLFLYLQTFYKKFHDELEKYMPNAIVFLGIYALVIFFEFYIYRSLIATTDAYVLRLEIFGVAIISVYIASIFFFNLLLQQYKKSFHKSTKQELLQRQLDSIVKQYRIREEKDKQTAILRHDMKHTLITLSSLIKQGKNDESLKLINERVKVIESAKVIKYCNDLIINSIISYYKNVCIENDISLKIKVRNIEPALRINSSEVAILISNCFDNAINASKKLTINKRIEFTFVNTDGKLVLQIKNNYKGQIQFDKNKMPTSLKENHGIGTQSIISFCKQHNLMLDYEINDNVFILSILF